MNLTRSGSAVTVVLYKLCVQIKVYKTLGDSQKDFLPAAAKKKKQKTKHILTLSVF